jgi:hypothetical protein
VSKREDPELRDRVVSEAIRPLLEASTVIGPLDFERLEPSRRAGRDVLRVRAVLREAAGEVRGR